MRLGLEALRAYLQKKPRKKAGKKSAARS